MPSAADSARFRPQPTVEDAYRAYQQWLALEENVARVPLFTQQSQSYLAGLPLTRGYKAGWLAMEYGKAYAVDQRGDLAMLYYTGTPFASPHFFRRSTDGWQLDVLGELHNTLEAIGGWYSWILLESGDEYASAFADRWQPFDDAGFGEYFRVAGGDNRRLMTRASLAEARPPPALRWPTASSGSRSVRWPSGSGRPRTVPPWWRSTQPGACSGNGTSRAWPSWPIPAAPMAPSCLRSISIRSRSTCPRCSPGGTPMSRPGRSTTGRPA
jgi:hypothetical protein